MNDDELGRALIEHALLEGDFVLRSGLRSRYYLDKYRFETQPELLAELGARLARAAVEADPEATRLAGPELGAIALATAASLSSGLPFLIVRKAAKAYSTGNRIEGVFEPGRAGVPDRGRRDDRRRASSEAVAGAAGGGPRVPRRRLRRRPRGGRSGCPRAPRGASLAPSSGPPSFSSWTKAPQTRIVEPKALAC